MSPYWAKQSSGSNKLLPTVICYNYERLPHTLSTQRSFLLRVWGAVLRCCLISKNEFLISIIWTSDINDKGFFLYAENTDIKNRFLYIRWLFYFPSNSKFWCQKMIFWFWYQELLSWFIDIKNFSSWYQKSKNRIIDIRKSVFDVRK